MNPVEHRSVAPEEVASELRKLLDDGGRVHMAYGWRPAPGRLELRYLASRGPRRPFVTWRCAPGRSMPSLTGIRPLLGWYEREIADLYGLPFDDHPEPHKLALHEGATPDVPPFAPDFPTDARLELRAAETTFPEIVGPDVQRLPWGPVRADVVESAEFVFSYIGERILHYQPRLFFKHRGMEKRFEGRTLAHGTALAERVSGVGSCCHALAFCQAVEAAAGCEVPERARLLRVLLAELERLYNHLHYLGFLADATTLKIGAAEGKYLEERAKQINGQLTGSRFLRGLLTPGGLRRDLDPKPWLGAALEALRGETAAYTERLARTNSYRDRLMTTGVLARHVVVDQGATGPVERASGVDSDLRRDHPYAAYADLPLAVPVRAAGDAEARAEIRVAEIEASLDLMQRVLSCLPEGPVRAECAAPASSEGLGWAESPRGGLFYAVHLDAEGRLARVKIKSPSFSNWRVFPFTVHDTNMMDYAISEASFGLTIAGCDR